MLAKIAKTIYKYKTSKIVVMRCVAILKSNNTCTFSAKYELLDHYKFYCKRHALSQTNELLSTEYDSIEEIPSLLPIECVSRVTSADISDILSNIKMIFGLSLTMISQELKTNSSTNVYVGDSTNMLDPQYIIRVVKQGAVIEKYSNGSAMYASICDHIDKPICVPIIPIEIDNKSYIVRGSKYNNWYYELIKPTYPLLGNNLKKLILRLVRLIELTQKNRIVHGSIELKNLTQLKQNRISSTVFTSLNNGMFWVDKYGNEIESGTNLESVPPVDQLVCSRRLQQKQYPGRYDDYESLLYLTQHLQNKRLPWIGLSTKVSIVQSKDQYLHNLMSSEEDKSSKIAEMILSSHFEDLPNYSKLYLAFEELF